MTVVHLTIIAVASFALAFSCVISLIISKFVKSPIKKQMFSKYRFSLACIFLSIFVLAFTFAFVSFDFLGYIKTIEKENLLYFGIIFLILFISGLSPRYILPFFLCLYLIYVAVAFVFLIDNFGIQKNNLEVKLEKNQITINDNFSLDLEKFPKEDKKYIAIKTLKIPEESLLPFPRFWFKIDSIQNNYQSDLSSSYKYIEKYITANFVEIPQIEFYPAYYELTVRFSEKSYTYNFNKLL